jgi:pimeloyl-ACP methyl ester carboxylesterase
LEIAKKITNYLQKRLIFQPKVLKEDYVFEFDRPHEEIWLPTDAGGKINALYFRCHNPRPKGIVWYAHGNKDNLQRWGNMHKDFTSRGYDFFVWDYRGYGKSTGIINEENCYKDAHLTWHWLRQHFKEKDIILYGRSLGTAMGCYLATKVSSKMLILETPFNSITGIMEHTIKGKLSLPLKPVAHFPNEEYLKLIDVPITIFHGTNDRIVPYTSAHVLQQYLKPKDVFITIPGGSHHNLSSYPVFQQKLDSLLL